LSFVSSSRTTRIQLNFHSNFALMHHTESRSVHNPSTSVQNETNWNDNTQTITSSASLTLMAS